MRPGTKAQVAIECSLAAIGTDEPKKQVVTSGGCETCDSTAGTFGVVATVAATLIAFGLAPEFSNKDVVQTKLVLDGSLSARVLAFQFAETLSVDDEIKIMRGYLRRI